MKLRHFGAFMFASGSVRTESHTFTKIANTHTTSLSWVISNQICGVKIDLRRQVGFAASIFIGWRQISTASCRITVSIQNVKSYGISKSSVSLILTSIKFKLRGKSVCVWLCVCLCLCVKAMRSAKVEPWRGVPWRSVIMPFPVVYRQRGLSVP